MPKATQGGVPEYRQKYRVGIRARDQIQECSREGTPLRIKLDGLLLTLDTSQSPKDLERAARDLRAAYFWLLLNIGEQPKSLRFEEEQKFEPALECGSLPTVYDLAIQLFYRVLDLLPRGT
jgi:hypothetical protein